MHAQRPLLGRRDAERALRRAREERPRDVEVDAGAAHGARPGAAERQVWRLDGHAEDHGRRQPHPAEDRRHEERLVGSLTGVRRLDRQLRRGAAKHLTERQRHEGERPGELRARRQQAHRHGHEAGRRPIGAGETYNYAGQLAFPGAAPIAKLEFVILVGAREKAREDCRGRGSTTSRSIPGQFEPAWAGWVQGEVVNNHAKLMLKSTEPLGRAVRRCRERASGARPASAYNALPPGTRQVFKLTNGIDSIPYSKVASVAISATPSWETNAPYDPPEPLACLRASRRQAGPPRPRAVRRVHGRRGRRQARDSLAR